MMENNPEVNSQEDGYTGCGYVYVNSHEMEYYWVTKRNTTQGSPLPPGQASSGGPLHLVHLQMPQMW